MTAPTSPSQPQSVQDAPEHYGAERASRSESPIEDALRALLRLANLQFSARLTLALLEHFAWDAERLFDASDAELDAIPAMQARHIVRLRDPAMQVTDRQWHWIEKREVRLVLLPEENYPRALREIHDPPPLLFVRGTLAETDRFGVGMVGSRHATPYGRSVAEKLARELAGRGLTVVSGGAVGIDAAAHRGALAGGGRTLAVLGCGLDVDYPRDHRALFEQIASQGALISEYPLGAQPEAWRFPLRNRLISGIAMGVLVVEAPRQSGALITASCAAEHGKTLMAIPGNIDRPSSEGTNQLLKDGAIIVTETEDILRALNVVVLPARPEHQRALDFTQETVEREGILSQSPTTFSAPDLHLPELQRKLLECLSLTPQHIDTIAQQAGLSAMQAGVEMTLLEINGLIRRLPGNTYIRVL